jgi:hypothetical protein
MQSGHGINVQKKQMLPPTTTSTKRPTPSYSVSAPISNKKQKTAHGSDSDSSEEGGDVNAEEQITPEERLRKESILQQMTHSQQLRHEAFSQSTFYKSQKKTFKNVFF